MSPDFGGRLRPKEIQGCKYKPLADTTTFGISIWASNNLFLITHLANVKSPIQVQVLPRKRGSYQRYKTWSHHISNQDMWSKWIVIRTKRGEIWLSSMTKSSTPRENPKQQSDNTKTLPKCWITQGLQTDLGCSTIKHFLFARTLFSRKFARA